MSWFSVRQGGLKKRVGLDCSIYLSIYYQYISEAQYKIILGTKPRLVFHEADLARIDPKAVSGFIEKTVLGRSMKSIVS